MSIGQYVSGPQRASDSRIQRVCVLVARVVDDQVGDHPDTSPVGLVDELGDIGDLAVLRQHCYRFKQC